MTNAAASFLSTPLPTVAILGCGWLGLPLARALVRAGYPVNGSTTTPGQLLTLRDAGITPFLLRLGPQLSPIDADTLRALLHDTEVLVLNIPPSRGAGSADAYPGMLEMVLKVATQVGVRHILHVSSTGVYPDEPRTMHETDAQASADAAAPLLRAEALFSAPAHTVVRLGGLLGPGRAAGRFLAGRHNLPLGDAPVNLIHLDDCVGLLRHIIAEKIWGHTFNACAANHPTRREFYPLAASQLGLEPPTFLPESASGKLIDSTLVRHVTGYTFQHDDVLAIVA